MGRIEYRDKNRDSNVIPCVYIFILTPESIVDNKYSIYSVSSVVMGLTYVFTFVKMTCSSYRV